MDLQESAKRIPPLQQEELAMGFACRLAADAKIRDRSVVQKFLFGYSTTEVASPFQAGLGNLQQYLCGIGHAPHDVINRHSIYPLIRIFEESGAEARRVESLLLQPKAAGQSLRGRMRLIENLFAVAPIKSKPSASPSPKRYPAKVCIDCVADELIHDRVPIWRRSQFLPGARWCDSHPFTPFFSECPWCHEPWLITRLVLPGLHCDCIRKRLGKGSALRDANQQRIAEIASAKAGIIPFDHAYHSFVYGLLRQQLDPIPRIFWAEALCAEAAGESATKVKDRLMSAGVLNDSLQVSATLSNELDELCYALEHGRDFGLLAALDGRTLTRLSAALFSRADGLSAVLQLVAQKHVYAHRSLADIWEYDFKH